MSEQEQAHPEPQARSRQAFRVAAGLLVALHLGKAMVFLAYGQPPLRWDAESYWRLGGALLEGHGAPRWWLTERPPGQPAFLALCQAAFGDRALVAAALLQQLALVATALAAAWTALRITASRAAFLIALALSLVSIERHYAALHMMADVLLGLWLVLYLALLVRWLERPSRGLAAGLGAVLALSMLWKPVTQLLWIPTLALLALRLHGGGVRLVARRLLPHATCLLIAMSALLAPWYLRNQLVHGEAFLVKFSGRNLWISAFHRFTGALPFADDALTAKILAASRGADVRDGWQVHRALREAGHDAIEAEEMMERAARSAIHAQPGLFARSVLRRLRDFWSVPWGDEFWRDADWGDAGYHGQRTFEVPALVALHTSLHARTAPLRRSAYRWAGVACAAGIAVMLAVPRARLPALAAAGLLVYVNAVIAVFGMVLYRYRMILEPVIVVTFTCGALIAARASQALGRLGRTQRAASRAPG